MSGATQLTLDAAAAKLEGQRLRELLDCGLHGGVDPEAGGGVVGLDRRDVHDRSAVGQDGPAPNAHCW